MDGRNGTNKTNTNANNKQREMMEKRKEFFLFSLCSIYYVMVISTGIINEKCEQFYFNYHVPEFYFPSVSQSASQCFQRGAFPYFFIFIYFD